MLFLIDCSLIYNYPLRTRNAHPYIFFKFMFLYPHRHDTISDRLKDNTKLLIFRMKFWLSSTVIIAADAQCASLHCSGKDWGVVKDLNAVFAAF